MDNFENLDLDSLSDISGGIAINNDDVYNKSINLFNKLNTSMNKYSDKQLEPYKENLKESARTLLRSANKNNEVKKYLEKNPDWYNMQVRLGV